MVVIFLLVDHTIDIHISILIRLALIILVIEIPPKTQRALEQKNCWVGEASWHSAISKVFHEDTAVHVLCLGLILVVEDLDINKFVEVHAVIEIPTGRLD